MPKILRAFTVPLYFGFPAGVNWILAGSQAFPWNLQILYKMWGLPTAGNRAFTWSPVARSS